MIEITLGEFITQRGTNIELPMGQTLFREGDASRAVYACVSGRINVLITTPLGREVILGSKVPGQAFGELSALDSGLRSATAVAMERTVVAQLSGDAFLYELAHAPHLSLALLRDLADHLRVSNGRAASRVSDNLNARMAHLLLELSGKFRRHGAPTNGTELPITQDELAAWIGVTREAASRSLGSMRKSGIIETGRNKIILKDMTELALLADEAGRNAGQVPPALPGSLDT